MSPEKTRRKALMKKKIEQHEQKKKVIMLKVASSPILRNNLIHTPSLYVTKDTLDGRKKSCDVKYSEEHRKISHRLCSSMTRFEHPRQPQMFYGNHKLVKERARKRRRRRMPKSLHIMPQISVQGTG